MKNIAAILVLILVCVTIETPASAQEKNIGQFFVNGLNPVTKDKDGKTDILMTAIVGANTGLQIADYALTRYGVDHGAKEANPLLRPLVHKEPLFFIAKIGVGTIIQNNLLKHFYRSDKKAGRIFGTAVIIFENYVVYKNVRVVIKL